LPTGDRKCTNGEAADDKMTENITHAYDIGRSPYSDYSNKELDWFKLVDRMTAYIQQ